MISRAFWRATRNMGSTVSFTRMLQDSKKIRILAFGDSLTQGETYNSTCYYPYTDKLEELLKRDGTLKAFDLDNAGITGEVVRNELISRLPKVLDKQGPYDLVIILGGTNDLIIHKKGDEKGLCEGIKNLHFLAHKQGAKTMLLTIPETDFYYKDLARTRKCWVKKDGEQGRVIVNEMLRDFAKSRDDVLLCDFEKEMPQASLSEEELDKYWDDGLHLTPEGYNRMGEIIFNKLKSLTLD